MDRDTIDKLKDIVNGLMFSDNLGEVHYEVDKLRDMIGMPFLQGNYEDGWSRRDVVGLVPDDELDEWTDYDADDYTEDEAYED